MVPDALDSVYATSTLGLSQTITYDYNGPSVTLGVLVLNLYGGNGTAAETLSMTSSNLTADHEFIGQGGAGFFDQSGGNNSATTFVDIGSGGGAGVYSLEGDGSLEAGTAEYFGEDSGSVGNFSQSGGSNSMGSLLLGWITGSKCSYTLSGTGLLSDRGTEYVGYLGTGNFNQTGGINAVSSDFYLGYYGAGMDTYALGGGSLIVSGNAYVGGGSGIMNVGNNGQLSVAGTLTMLSGGRANLDVSNTTVGNISIGGNGIVNLNGGLTINYGSPPSDPISSVVSYLQSGYNGGTWAGTSGIISTSAQNQSGPAVTLGYADGNTDAGTAAGPNQIVVKYTLVGDANLDGLVNFQDLVAVVQNFNKPGTDWAQGNFLYGASTGFQDLVAVVQNFNKVLPPPSGSGAELGATTIPLIQSTDVQLPEPGISVLTALAAAGILGRRRRKIR
jgi:hypothetical protein